MTDRGALAAAVAALTWTSCARARPPRRLPGCAATDRVRQASTVCRNIKTLFNFDPPVTDDEIRAASRQFVRKITGFNTPSRENDTAFAAAVEGVARVSRDLLDALQTTARPKNREAEAEKARARRRDTRGV